MTCGITVAPRIPVASRTLSVPSKPGHEQPAAMPAASGLACVTSKPKATTTTPTRPAITASSRRKPRRCSARITKAPAPAIRPAGKSGIPNRRLRPSAAPTNSARSVAIATSSAWTQSPREVRRVNSDRQTSGQVPAGGDPELRRLGLDQHRHQVRGEDDPEQHVAELGAAGDVGGEVAGVDVRDRGDEGRAEEGPQAPDPPARAGPRASGAPPRRPPPRPAGPPRSGPGAPPRRRGPARPRPAARARSASARLAVR